MFFIVEVERVGGSALHPKQFLDLQEVILKPLALALTLLLRLTAKSTIGVIALPFLPLFLLGELSSIMSSYMASISFAVTGSELSWLQASE